MISSTSSAQFSALLQRALDRIAFLENKTHQRVYEEIGYAIGRSGSSALQYWVYHKKAPARLTDLEALARVLTQRQGWSKEDELLAFLSLAAHPAAEIFSRQIYQPASELRSALPVKEGSLPSSGFFVGAPVREPRSFFGRGRELRRILTALNPRAMQPVWISGPANSGKTSLLLYLKSVANAPTNIWAHALGAYRWLLVDFQDPRVHSPLGFYAALLGQFNLELPRSLDPAAGVDLICQAVTAPTVLLLDNAHIAAARAEFDPDFWTGLRSLVVNLTNGKLTFIATLLSDASPSNQPQPTACPFLDPSGHRIELGPLEPDEARALIRSSPRRFSAEDEAWILEQSYAWPDALQTLCAIRLFALEENLPASRWQKEAQSALAILKLGAGRG